MMLGTTYPKAIEAAGAHPGRPRAVELEAVPSLVARLDGICLAGGPDLDPVAYGADRPPPRARRHQRRARRLRARRRPRRRRGRPADARHLPRRAGAERRARRDAAPARRWPPPDRARRHADAARRRRARLAAGRHHRRRRQPRDQLLPPPGRRRPRRRTARRRAGADGTVEAIEDPARPFLLGVQWHAETLTERAEHGALFAALIAGRRRAAAASGRAVAVAPRNADRDRGQAAARSDGAASARSSPAVRLGQRRALGGLDLEQQRRVVLAQRAGDTSPGQRAPPGRQVEVELQRVDPRRVDVAPAHAEVVVDVEEHDVGRDRGSDEGGIAVRRVGRDVQVADVEQHPRGRRGQPAHEVAHGQRVVAQPRRRRMHRRQVLDGDRHAKRVRPLEVA